MDLFDLAAKLTLDSSQYEKAVSSAAGASKTAQKAVDSLRSPIDRVRGAFEAVKNPVQTVKKGWENLKSAANNLAHPIQTMKTRLDESQTAAQKNQSIMAGLAKDYDKARDKVAQLTAEYKKSVAESGNTSDKSIALAKAVDQAEKEAAQAEQAMTEYAESLKKTGKDSDSTAEKQSKLGSALKKGLTGAIKGAGVALAAGTAAVVAFGKQAIEASANFETSFAKLSTIMDTTQKSATDMQAGIMEMSSRMGISASELAETAYNAISATGDTAGALDVVESASKLASAGFTDSASALSVLTTTMNAYGMTAEETSKISDSLITVQNLGVTTVAELSSAMGKAIATGSAYGVDLYNLESAYISLTKNGINTAESTTYISSMLKELGSDSTNVAKIIKSKTGKSFAQLMNDGESLGDVLGILNDYVDGDSAALINLWGSAEAGKASAAIAAQGLDAFNENLDAVANSAGATDTAFSTMSDTIGHKMQVLTTGFENLKISVGNNMLPVVGDVLSTVSDGIGNITTAIQAGDWDGAFSALGETLGNVVNKIVENAPMIVKAAIKLITSLATALTDNADTLIDAAFEIINVLVEYLGDPDGLMKLIDSALLMLEKLAEGLIENIPILLPALMQIIIDIVDRLTQPDTISQMVDVAVSLLIALADGLISSIGMLLDKAPEIIQNLVDAVIENAPKLLDAALEILAKLGEGIHDGLDSLLNIGKSIVEGIWDGINGAFDWIKEKIEGWVGNVMSFFKGLLGIASPSKWARDMIGKNLALGMAVGIEANTDKVEDAMSGLTRDVKAQAEMQIGMSDLGMDRAMVNRSIVVSHNDQGGEIGQLVDLMRVFLPQIVDRQIVLDSGELVGSLAYKMDGALGARTAYAARGMA